MAKKITITCISDLHGAMPDLPGGDLLIMAGGCTARDTIPQWGTFFEWFKAQPYRKRILVAGNHDGYLNHCMSSADAKDMGVLEDEGFEYLCDSGTTFEGLKIWGSPWTTEFCAWHFMLPRSRMKEKWDLIPDDTHILITHGPPNGVLDVTEDFFEPGHMVSVGCYQLRKAVERVKPHLHVFGHIHSGYGQFIMKHDGPHDTLCINAAIMDEQYKPTNKPHTMELQFYNV